MKTWSKFGKDNKGASLIAVLVAIAVVGVMGTVIMQLTVTNIQMKEVERQSKTNFYTAEQILDMVTANINEKAAEQMQLAFTEILSKYKNYEGQASNLRKLFSKKYLDGLVQLCDATIVGEGDSAVSEAKHKRDAEDSNRILYTIGLYKISLFEECTPLAIYVDGNHVVGLYTAAEVTAKDSVIIARKGTDYDINIHQADATHPNGAAYFHADYDKGTFTLDNVSVYAKDAFGNETYIQTDLVFHTPDLNLDGSNVVKEFMRYSLIADDQIKVTVDNVNVDGNVYAGAGGILADYNSSAQFVGRKIITRGDIQAKSMSNLSVGNADKTVSQIWVNNLKTLRDNTRVTLVNANATNAATLNICGTSYVADDLEVNGAYDHVTVKGTYKGYNFQQNYATVERTEDARYSSAIAINGKESDVNISGIDNLMIAGRAFISRESGDSRNQDIMTGETMSVRINQLAYYVPMSCMKALDASHPDDKTFQKDLYEAYSGVSNIERFVNLTDPVAEYYYDASGTKIYYLKLKGEQAANDFYREYYEAHKGTMDLRAENYLTDTSLQLSADIVMNLKGDLLYRKGTVDASGKYPLVERYTDIDESKWNYGTSFYKQSADFAIKYKSLCLSLEENKLEKDYSNVRLQESDPTLWHNLISQTQWDAFFDNDEHEDETVIEWTDATGNISGTKLIAIIRNKTGATYNVKPSTYDGGIVIADGDVHVEGSGTFSGLIISGGTITFDSGAKVRADEVLVSNMIANDITLRNPTFANIFKDYADSANQALNGTSIERYMTMENWTKTVE